MIKQAQLQEYTIQMILDRKEFDSAYHQRKFQFQWYLAGLGIAPSDFLHSAW